MYHEHREEDQAAGAARVKAAVRVHSSPLSYAELAGWTAAVIHGEVEWAKVYFASFAAEVEAVHLREEEAVRLGERVEVSSAAEARLAAETNFGDF